jgi:glycosyltransferase involved in cell wall biosynthesis
MSETISVIIPTGRGGPTLARALASVVSQTFASAIEILVVPDPTLAPRLELPVETATRRHRILRVQGELPADTSERLARMRNYALELATGEFIAFLDDDNAYLPHHLERLHAALLRTGADAAHSWRRILDVEQRPWFADRHPWKPDEPAALTALDHRRFLHVGTSLLMDRQRDARGEQGMVDTSAWLIRTPTIRRHPFPEQRSESDRHERVTEDDLLLGRLLAAGTSITSSLLPTVLYSLGGYSNT